MLNPNDLYLFVHVDDLSELEVGHLPGDVLLVAVVVEDVVDEAQVVDGVVELPRVVLQGARQEAWKHTETVYLTTHSTHFIYGYMASDIWLRTSQNTLRWMILLQDESIR